MCTQVEELKWERVGEVAAGGAEESRPLSHVPLVLLSDFCQLQLVRLEPLTHESPPS